MKNCSSTGFVRVILQQGSMLLHVLSVPIALPLGHLANIETSSAGALSTGPPAHRETTVVHSVVLVVQDVDHPPTLERLAWARCESLMPEDA